MPEGVGASAPAGLDLELGQDVGDMRTNRSRADEECHRDFAVRMTVHQQAQYLALARRQPRDSAIIVLTLGADAISLSAARSASATASSTGNARPAAQAEAKPSSPSRARDPGKRALPTRVQNLIAHQAKPS